MLFQGRSTFGTAFGRSLGVLEMQTAHCPMVTEPQQLVRLLLALSAAPH